jgi:hypothetical protein
MRAPRSLTVSGYSTLPPTSRIMHAYIQLHMHSYVVRESAALARGNYALQFRSPLFAIPLARLVARFFGVEL